MCNMHEVMTEGHLPSETCHKIQFDRMQTKHLANIGLPVLFSVLKL